MVAPRHEAIPARPAGDAPFDEESHRQCGRCRVVFVLDPVDDARGTNDWWVCEPCRARLTPNWSRR